MLLSIALYMMDLAHELTIVLSFHRKTSGSSKGRSLNTMAFQRVERLPGSSVPTDRLSRYDVRPAPPPTSSTLRSSASRRSSTHENLGATASTSRPVLNGRTLFNDPVNVQQWVVTTSTGSTLPTDHSCSSDIGQRGLTYDDASTTGSFLSGGALASDFHLSDELRSTCFSNTGEMSNDLHYVNRDLTSSAFYPLDFDFNDFSASAVLPCDSWTGVDTGSYSVPGPADMMYTTSTESHSFAEAEYQASPSGSTSDAYLPGTDLLRSDYDECVLDPSLWCSPDSGIMDPSVSSFSQGNLFPQLAGSPSSFSTQEEMQPLDPVEEFGFSPLTLDVPSSMSYTSSSIDEQFDPARFVPITIASLPSSNIYFSTIKAVQAFQRPALSSLVTWPTCDSIVCPPVMSTYGDTRIPRRMSNESEHIPARHNELYQIGPREDGLYHCPFEKKDGCTHKPEKLKCNYE